jgi:hypothetical protein
LMARGTSQSECPSRKLQMVALKHTEKRKMEAYRRRLHPALRYLSPRQKAAVDQVWQPWSWRTSGYVTGHLTAFDSQGIKQLIGYGRRGRCKRKTYSYDRALIATNKPKYKLPQMPKTLWGEALKLIEPGGTLLTNGE